MLSFTQTELAFTLTNIYAPSDHRDSPDFLEGLVELASHVSGPWILAGDFNLLRDSHDKNTAPFNLALAASFNNTINQLQLLGLPLLDQLFTWTNNRTTPTLARLDRILLNNDMNHLFANMSLTSLTRINSDHTPLLTTISTTIPKPSSFHLDTAWLHYSCFLPVVLPAWFSSLNLGSASAHLAGSLKSVRHVAKVWHKGKFTPPLIIHNCKILIYLFDVLEESRILSVAACLLRHACQDQLATKIKARAAY